MGYVLEVRSLLTRDHRTWPPDLYPHRKNGLESNFSAAKTHWHLPVSSMQENGITADLKPKKIDLVDRQPTFARPTTFPETVRHGTFSAVQLLLNTLKGTKATPNQTTQINARPGHSHAALNAGWSLIDFIFRCDCLASDGRSNGCGKGRESQSGCVSGLNPFPKFGDV